MEDQSKEIERLRLQVKNLEKLSSLGMLSAGIAHEIQNPLNFVINFSKLSSKLVDDLEDILEEEKDVLPPESWEKLTALHEEFSEIVNDLHGNLKKIEEHGNRATSIIRGILLYSRGKDDEYIPTDIKNLVKEYVWLAYHSMRANYKGFNIAIREHYEEGLPMLKVIPQDLSRAVLNVMNNACYAVYSKSKLSPIGYEPVISVDLRKEGDSLRLSIEDNGIGMPEMDGLTLLTKINEMRNPALKCIIVSAYGDMENIRTAMNHGAFDFATKPIDMEDLERTIEKAVEQISFIKEAQKEHHQLEEIQYDLNVAREIQQSILPKQFPPFPQYKQFDLYATMSAAKAVGGDFYDFFLVDDNHLGFTIADVSDKGIPAAIFMAISRTVIRATALRQLSPAVCMKESNDLLCRESVNGMFVTTFYAILNIHTGDVVYCNGGHNRPVWIRKNDKVSLLPMTGGMALGVVPGLAYKEQSLKLEAGDSLFLYTDGISEAMNLRNEQYGDIRLVEACSSVKNQSPKSMIEGISESVQSFVNGATQSDDITMLALTYKG